MQERLQKILSARGVCSRRQAEKYIEQGLVKVNGVVASIGDKADPAQDEIEVGGKVVEDRAKMLYYVLHKPVGVVTTNRGNTGNKGKTENTRWAVKSVRDLLPHHLQGILFPVGRLDKDSSGLLLFTNDGVLAYRLTHPKFTHEKEYAVTVAHEIKDGQLDKLRRGMTIDGVKTKPAVVRRTGKRSFTIILTEGKNRQIRRMCQKVGSPVVNLTRVRIVTLTDATLKEGQLRELSNRERKVLLESIGVDLG